MAIAMVLTVAQTVFAAIDSEPFKEVCSMFGYKSQLEDLKNTMSAIRSVLFDAELKEDHEPLNHATQDWINKLKDAVYDVDDLLDEFNTLAQRKKLMDANGNKISKKVSRFFSRSNELVVAFKMYRDIKKNNKRLDAIASDHAKYGFDTKSQPRTREETVSFVYEEKIIGREREKEEIVSTLLDTNVDKRVSFVTIVGMGGLGKTTLAQLVYNDDRIKSMFKELRLWVCVGKKFSMESILQKVLLGIKNQSCDHLRLDQLQKDVQNEIGGKSYFLILDDVWEETRYKWVELIEFFEFCGSGSKILVTSRSKDVAKVIGNGHVHELQGLSDDESWQLFKQMAFTVEEENIHADLVDIGKDIVKKCSNVPLCIKVIGSFLFSENIERWSLFQKNDLSKIQKANDVTMETLMFSYFHLTPQLKCCFSYCALFPKNHGMSKHGLIDLWMANGCIVVESNEVRCVEDVGQEYFSILIQRCFFQGIEFLNNNEEIVFCKVHDLMHDLALKVAGHDRLILPSMESLLHEKVRHLSVDRNGCMGSNVLHDYLAKIKTIRTFHQFGITQQSADFMMLIPKCKCLRFLDLSDCSLTTLPSEIGGLIHLRYLDISMNQRLKMLPESITNLINLQHLKLLFCRKLQALPMHFSRLVNLRHLYINGCDGLTAMPRGLKNLSCLQRLTDFKLGVNSKDIQLSQLEDLKALVNLRDKLVITLKELSSNGLAQFRQGAYLLEKKHLKKLKVQFSYEISEGDVQEALLEGLQPCHDLQCLKLHNYQGAKFPIWASPGNALRSHLPRLVKINLIKLPRLHHLPIFSRLSSLKYLVVDDIPNLEYIENENVEPSKDLTFFPSLVMLTLNKLPRLKRWWKDSVIRVDVEEQEAEANGSNIGDNEQGVGQSLKVSSFVIFQSLLSLRIQRCPNMKSLPPCPHLKELDLYKFNELLLFREKRGGFENHNKSSKFSLTSVVGTKIGGNPEQRVIGLTHLRIDNIEFLGYLFSQFVPVLSWLHIKEYEGERLSKASEAIRKCGLSLEELSIIECRNLKSLSGGGIEHLSCLRSLSIKIAPQLELEDDEDGMPWRSLHSLSNLDLSGIGKMINLPRGIQYLTALQWLRIDDCWVDAPLCNF